MPIGSLENLSQGYDFHAKRDARDGRMGSPVFLSLRDVMRWMRYS